MSIPTPMIEPDPGRTVRSSAQPASETIKRRLSGWQIGGIIVGSIATVGLILFFLPVILFFGFLGAMGLGSNPNSTPTPREDRYYYYIEVAGREIDYQTAGTVIDETYEYGDGIGYDATLTITFEEPETFDILSERVLEFVGKDGPCIQEPTTVNCELDDRPIKVTLEEDDTVVLELTN